MDFLKDCLAIICFITRPIFRIGGIILMVIAALGFLQFLGTMAFMGVTDLTKGLFFLVIKLLVLGAVSYGLSRWMEFFILSR